MNSAGELPSGWSRAILADCCEIMQGQSPPGESYNTEGAGLPFFQGKAEFGSIYPTVAKWCSKPTKLAAQNDVLISIRAPVGPTNLCPEEACIGRGLAAVRPLGGIPARYVLYALRTSEHQLASKGSGSTFDAISGNDLRAHQLSLAPLSEQHRIVAEIEKQFTRLDASLAALERVRANLKRYRAATLAAACEGWLVPTEAELARAEGREYESGAELLQRLLADQRSRWQAEQAASQTGKTAAAKTYEEPWHAESTLMPSLPAGWSWSLLEQVTQRSEYGTSVKCAYDGTGHPVLRIPNVVSGRVDLRDLKYSEQRLSLRKGDALQSGDLLLCRTNGSINLIGRSAVVAVLPPGDHSFASYLLRFRLVEEHILPRWLHLFLEGPGRWFIEVNAASSAGQNNISLRLLHSMPLPLPPLAEQHRIVAEVERRLSLVEKLESAVADAQKRAAALRQSILKRAFEGTLAPQDPDDEPADVLLQRIRAERAAQSVDSGAPKHAGRKKVRP